MVHLISAAALALYGFTLSPATALVSAETFSVPPPHSDKSHPQSPSSAASSSSSSSSSGFAPSPDHARENAVHIFNEVHSAMRQWGSSLHHNGMGLIPATVPKGTVLYHGTRSNSTPEEFEWLAFEMEHSENFARSWRKGRGMPPPGPPGKGKGKLPGGGGPPGGPRGGQPIIPMVEGQKPLVEDDDKRPPRGPGGPGGPARGYLHMYRANRDLKLLYIDGMSAGKTGMGTLDTQDSLLRGIDNAPGFGEYERASDLCKAVKGWGLDGVIRMEIGFESIYCDFSDGLDLLSVLRRPWNDQVEGEYGIDMFEWARAVGQRYDGIGAGRVKLDFGGMVSGLWYPLNVSNPNGRRDMPRLGQLAEEERRVILGRVEEIVKGAKWNDGKVDWQGIVDMIVSRYADRIEAMADESSVEDYREFLSQVLVVTNTFVDYPQDEYDSAVGAAVRGEDEHVKEARERCAKHYLTPAAVRRDEWTPEDGMIHVAVSAIAERICKDLFHVRGLVLEAAPKLADAFSEAQIRNVVAAAVRGDDDGKLGRAVEQGREAIMTLKEDLGWSMWKKCKPGCDVAEICFIAMWPFGLKEDHYHPSCHNRSSMANREGRGGEKGYWEWEPRSRLMG
ncbi:uncharacterized protein ColSpa_09913 [Colletotrichum spaethianum]|uniref:Uncharacterized protein n=1 Tax=Colletotrichum spaethianum TaxID=700344 RepID=A0AA37PCL3_9PEZI|nr:uncharacterized protein ColSpa_09913 [Colletotrichum spaethianum]GKT49732.1 uncharacterized protein ColSpa_09913 [Colletotrichum spaethianum]